MGALSCVPKVPKVLLQTCCLSTSYTLVRVGTYRNNVKRTVGWVTQVLKTELLGAKGRRIQQRE